MYMNPSTLFSTLADPTRLRLLDALRAGERAVGDLAAHTDVPQPGVSRHLRILHQAGFVAVRADGPRRLYALRPEPFRAIDAWAVGYRALWEGRLARFERALAAKPRRSS
jgi:DNA-binding transcriptional ArsR family regulator